MSVETLYRAAAVIREDWADCDCHAFERAVADMLVRIAERADEIADTIGSERVATSVIESNLTGYTEALTVAKTYLSEVTA